MKKLRLEDLAVDSFVTAPHLPLRGTVQGHATEAVSCNWSCAGTCDPTQHGLCATDEPGCQANSVGLSACCATNTCTQNPYDAGCHNSYDFCVETALCPTAPMVCDTLTVCGGV